MVESDRICRRPYPYRPLHSLEQSTRHDPAQTQFTRAAVSQIYPDRVVYGDEFIWYAAEPFSKYSQLAPAVFVFPGIKNESFGSGAEHHNDQFDIDPESLQYALGAMLQFAVSINR